jgi:hypothetical protein
VEQFSGNPCASTLRFFPPKGFNIDQLVDIRLRLRIEPSTPAQYANPGENWAIPRDRGVSTLSIEFKSINLRAF